MLPRCAGGARPARTDEKTDDRLIAASGDPVILAVSAVASGTGDPRASRDGSKPIMQPRARQVCVSANCTLLPLPPCSRECNLVNAPSARAGGFAGKLKLSGNPLARRMKARSGAKCLVTLNGLDFTIGLSASTGNQNVNQHTRPQRRTALSTRVAPGNVIRRARLHGARPGPGRRRPTAIVPVCARRLRRFPRQTAEPRRARSCPRLRTSPRSPESLHEPR